MKRLLTAVLAPATAAGVVLVAPTTSHAAAAPTITAINVKPALAVQTGANRQKITVQIHTDAADVDALAIPNRGGGGIVFSPKKVREGLWEASDYLYNWESAGAWTVDVTALDADFNDTKKSKTFQVRRATYFAGFNASPSKVRRGKAISVAGQLRGLNNYGEYVPFRGQKVTIYFKKKGTQKWVRYAVVTTAKNGKFAKRFSAKASGWWIAGYAGNATWYKSFSKNDGVVVR